MPITKSFHRRSKQFIDLDMRNTRSSVTMLLSILANVFFQKIYRTSSLIFHLASVFDRRYKNVTNINWSWCLPGNFESVCECTFSINNIWNWLFIFCANNRREHEAWQQRRWKFHYRFNQREWRHDTHCEHVSSDLSSFQVKTNLFFKNPIHHPGLLTSSVIIHFFLRQKFCNQSIELYSGFLSVKTFAFLFSKVFSAFQSKKVSFPVFLCLCNSNKLF